MFLTSNDENKLFFVLFIYNSFFYINKISNLNVDKFVFIGHDTLLKSWMIFSDVFMNFSHALMNLFVVLMNLYKVFLFDE
jgi:hypothetical protein